MADSTRLCEEAEAIAQQQARDARNKKRRENYARNREKCLLYMSNRRKADPEKWRALDAASRTRNRDKRNARNREYMRQDRIKNPEKYKAKSAAKRLKNPESHRRRSARYYKKHKEKALASNLRYERRKRKEDPIYALAKRLRGRLQKALAAKTAKKIASTFALVGCSPDQLARHIESQFVPGMTWENRSEWHIDHIIPVAKFDLSDEEQQMAAFHYTNLQPLWAADNRKKSDKVTGQHLFGFAYVATIAKGDRPSRSGHATNDTRQHCHD